MIEQRKIVLNNKIVPYEVQYKNIKNCYLRIEKGKVKISTSRLYSIQDIENLIRKNQSAILQQLENYIPKVLYQDKGYVYLFNKRFKIVVRDLNIKKCVIHNQDIYIYSSQIQQTLDVFLKEQLYTYIYQRIKEYLYHDFHLPMPEIRIKKMKSRWGVCYYLKNKVCFSMNLVHLDYDLIDYVIVHELCHFIESNHSKKFYLEIEKRIPDYQLREKRLKDNT